MMLKKSRTALNEIEDHKRCISLVVEVKNHTYSHNKLHRTKNWVYKWIKYYKSGDLCWHPGHIHKLDLTTPKYVTGYGKVVSVNRIDVFLSQANLYRY